MKTTSFDKTLRSKTAASILERARPTVFEGVIGCEQAKRRAQNAIRRNRILPGYLFTGQKGSGKTTLARIMATALMCLERADGEHNPCGRCINCLCVFDEGPLPRRPLYVRNCADYTTADFDADLKDMEYAADGLPILFLDEFHRAKWKIADQILTLAEQEDPRAMFLMIAPTIDGHENIDATALKQRFGLIETTAPPTDEFRKELRRVAFLAGLRVSDEFIEKLVRRKPTVRAAIADMIDADLDVDE